MGREYQVGTDLGPAGWRSGSPISRFAPRAITLFGVYLLAQLCSVATFWTLYLLGARGCRRTTGGARGPPDHDDPGVQFARRRVRSPVLARPLWALLLLHSWQLIGQNRRNAWFAWSIEVGFCC